MATTVKIEVKDNDIVSSLQVFLKSVLEQPQIGAMLVSQHLPMKNVVMPTLVTDPEAPYLHTMWHVHGILPQC